jgi:hypothetical protein
MGREQRIERSSAAPRARTQGPAGVRAQPPDVAGVLHLQRAAGNKAVAAASRIARDITLGLEGLVQQSETLLGPDLTFQLRLSLLNLTSDIGTYAIVLDTFLIQAEIARLQEETAQIELGIDHDQGHPGYRSAERLRVLAGLAGGNTDDMALTDIVFFERHPDRRDRLLDPADPADKVLVREWVKIRREIVGGVLNSQLGKALRLPRKEPAADEAQPAAPGAGAS